jgi:hypothetical protein
MNTSGQIRFGPGTARPGRWGVVDTGLVQLLIARNPDPDSRLPYLLRVPLGDGLVFRTAGTWPRTNALYCHPVPAEHWPAQPDLVEQVPVRSCVRRGAAIDLVLDRGREQRSQLVYTMARGREVVFWQSARSRKQARPGVRTPTARAAGIADLEIVVDTHEQYPYRFANQQVRIVRRALPCGDYGLVVDGRLVASVERKSLADLVGSLTGGKLRYALADLAALPRAAVVVEARDYVGPSRRSAAATLGRSSMPACTSYADSSAACSGSASSAQSTAVATRARAKARS